MPVNSPHPDYNQKTLKRWQLVRDVVNNDATCHVRTVDPSDPVRSSQYKEGCILPNFTALTMTGLTGMIFRKSADTTLPAECDYLLNDATGTGLTLEQLAKEIADEVQQTGRYGLLVDHPESLGEFTLAEQKSLNIAPRILPYRAESILNWYYKTIGSKRVLSLLVLKEDAQRPGADGFEWICEVEYRVLALNSDGNYIQIKYDKDLKPIGDWVMPLDGQGRPFNVIPWEWVGASNNDEKMDKAPLYDLAVLGIGALRNSCDLEESSYVCGQIIPVVNIGDMSEEQFDSANPGGIKIASRRGVVINGNGSFTLQQASPNSLPRELITDKLKQAVQLGARLVQDNSGRETAQAARIRFSSQNSAVFVLAKNISEGIEDSINHCCKFLGLNNPQINYELNTEFYDEVTDPNILMASIQLLDRGVIGRTDVQNYLTATDFLNRPYDEINAEAEMADPMTETDSSYDNQG